MRCLPALQTHPPSSAVAAQLRAQGNGNALGDHAGAAVCHRRAARGARADRCCWWSAGRRKRVATPTSCAPGPPIPRRSCCSPRRTRCRTTACRTTPTNWPSAWARSNVWLGLSLKRRRPPLVVASVRAAMDLLLDPSTFRDRHRALQRGQALPPAELAAELLQPGLRALAAGRSARPVQPPRRHPGRLPAGWPAPADRVLGRRDRHDSTLRPGDPALDRAARSQLDRPGARGLAAAAAAEPQAGRGSAAVRRSLRTRSAAAARRRPGVQHARVLSRFSRYRRTRRLPPRRRDPGHRRARRPSSTLAREFEEQVEQLHADLLERGEIPPGLARPYRPWAECLRERARGARAWSVRLDPDAESLPFVHAPKYGGRLDPFLGALVDRTSADLDRRDPAGEPTRGAAAGAGRAARASEMRAERRNGIQLVNGLLREGWISRAAWARAVHRQRDLRLDQAAPRGADTPPDLRARRGGARCVHRRPAARRPGGARRPRHRSLRRPGADAAGRDTRPGVGARAARPRRVPAAALRRERHPVRARSRRPTALAATSARAMPSRRSRAWAAASGCAPKPSVRRSVRDLAQELMELYGARAALEGHAYPEDTAWQLELEGSFPYEETPDQVEAIRDVKADMDVAAADGSAAGRRRRLRQDRSRAAGSLQGGAGWPPGGRAGADDGARPAALQHLPRAPGRVPGEGRDAVALPIRHASSA